jgi:hypothetical protein
MVFRSIASARPGRRGSSGFTLPGLDLGFLAIDPHRPGPPAVWIRARRPRARTAARLDLSLLKSLELAARVKVRRRCFPGVSRNGGQCDTARLFADFAGFVRVPPYPE